MFYVGSGVPSASGYWNEPCLIDPDLAVDWRRPDWFGSTMSKWPSYEEADPRGRAAYLEWLAGGRQNDRAHIGYALLFLFGLERRLLVDIGSNLDHPDVPFILVELLRLVAIYGDDASFAEAAGSLIALVESLAYVRMDIEDLPAEPESIERNNRASDLIVLGKYAGSGLRIPAGWAERYLHHHPETKLRTAAKRCPAEFSELFMARYRTRFRGGIRVRRPPSNLRLEYLPSSHGFRGMMVFESALGAPGLAGDFRFGHGGEVIISLDGVPDITSAPSLIGKLWTLAEECTDELDAYSRFIGGDLDRALTPMAVSLLPDVLFASRGGPILDDLRRWISDALDRGPPAVVQLDELVQKLSPGFSGKLTRRDALSLVSALGKIQVGMEPDVRFGAPPPKPASRVVLFRLPAGAPEAPSPAYLAAMPIIHLAAVVAGADRRISPDQRRFLARHLEQAPALDEAERRRLASHFEFLATGRLGMYGVKSTVETIPADRRAAAGSFLIDLATADGAVSREEVAALEKVFGYLGLDQADVYRRLHGLDARDPGHAPAGDIRPATRREVAAAGAVTPLSPSVSLDPARVQARLSDTARVSALLSDIFTEDEDSGPPPPPTGPEAGSIIGGLDEPHSQLLTALVSQTEWDRGSVEEMARSLGLPFLDSALDVIDEATIELCGEPIVECHNPVVLSNYVLKELT